MGGGIAVPGGAPCAVRKAGCVPPPVAAGPRVLNSAPLMRFGMDHARFCGGVVCRGVPEMNTVIIGAVRNPPPPSLTDQTYVPQSSGGKRCVDNFLLNPDQCAHLEVPT